MNKVHLLATLALLAGCGGGTQQPTNPAITPEGKLCGRAYGSTMDSLTKLFKKAGESLPADLPTRAAYIDKCLELGFTEEQVRCLDPKMQEQDPEGCQTTLTPVKDKKAQMDKLFSDAFDKAAEKKADPKPAEGAPAEGAPAEGAPAEGAPAE